MQLRCEYFKLIVNVQLNFVHKNGVNCKYHTLNYLLNSFGANSRRKRKSNGWRSVLNFVRMQ